MVVTFFFVLCIVCFALSPFFVIVHQLAQALTLFLPTLTLSILFIIVFALFYSESVYA